MNAFESYIVIYMEHLLQLTLALNAILLKSLSLYSRLPIPLILKWFYGLLLCDLLSSVYRCLLSHWHNQFCFITNISTAATDSSSNSNNCSSDRCNNNKSKQKTLNKFGKKQKTKKRNKNKLEQRLINETAQYSSLYRLQQQQQQ